MVGRQAGFWDFEHRLRQLSERGDPLEKLAATVDFEIFRAELVGRVPGGGVAGEASTSSGMAGVISPPLLASR